MAKEKSNYTKVLDSILNSVYLINKVDNNTAVSDAYRDTYMTEQQRIRDKKVTELLEQYVSEYEYKNKNNKWYKNILFGASMFLLVFFSVAFLVLIFDIDFNAENTSVEAMAQVISVCVTFLALIVGILTIITKNVFPENEQEYITRIVEIIQNNDLENKKQNIKVHLATKEKIEDETIDIESIF